METKKTIILTALALMPMLSQAQLLKGHLNGAERIPEDALVTYSPDGNMFNNQMKELTFGQNGTFSYDTELTASEGDIVIEIDGIGYFGAHLVKGKTVEMTIAKGKNGAWEATFKGEQPKTSLFVNQYTQSFDMMKYWSPDPSEGKPIAEYRRMLDEEYNKVCKLLPTLKDKQQRDYYTRLTAALYAGLKIRLIMDSCDNDKTDYKLNSEYQQLVKGVDINDPVNVQTNMAYTALNSLGKVPQDAGFGPQCEELMALSDKHVTNPALRTFLVQMIGQSFFVYGKGEGDAEAFIKKYMAWAGKDSLIAKSQVEQFRIMQKSMEGTAAGTKAPDITLNKRDGSQVQLSDIVGHGKFTYIDVWATWCGPCVKEIPFVEKLVEKFKDNPKVQFISISVDQNVQAWEKKLDNDKPQWAQYILTPENNQIFSKDWGITGIPRFIMIDQEGNIFSGDATRPSEPKTEETILGEIGK